MRRFGWIITLPLAALGIVFAVNNNGSAEIDIWPLPFRVELPLFALCFAGILIGFFAGALSAWISGHRWRHLARQEARDIAVLKRSLAAREERSGGGGGQADASKASLAAPSAGQPVARGDERQTGG